MHNWIVLKNNFKFALKLTLKSSYMFRCKTPSSGMYVCDTGLNQTNSDSCHTHTLYQGPNYEYNICGHNADNCNFIKAQIVCSLRMVFETETCRSFLMSILMQI